LSWAKIVEEVGEERLSRGHQGMLRARLVGGKDTSDNAGKATSAPGRASLGPYDRNPCFQCPPGCRE
jgi:hypothetical protein